MPCFKRRNDGEIVEVDEHHAEEVLRRQTAYEEIECPAKSAPTENTDSAPANANTSPKKSAGRPKKPTKQRSTQNGKGSKSA